MAILHQPQGLKAKRLVAVGGGKKDKFDRGRRSARPSARGPRRQAKGREEAGLVAIGDSDAVTAEAAVEGAISATTNPIMNKPSSDAKPLESFSWWRPRNPPNSKQRLKRGVILAEAQNFTRDLVNEPANLMTPTIIAQHAQQMAHDFGLESKSSTTTA